MTSTTTETGAGQHERPCYCEVCMLTTLSDLIDERGKLLDGAFLDGLYTTSFERQLAEELIAAIPASRRAAVLEQMLEWDHLCPRVMIVDCLLDDCETSSYEVFAELARILHDAIHAQGAEGSALRILVENQICKQRPHGWPLTFGDPGSYRSDC